MITVDKGIPNQQSIAQFDLCLIVLLLKSPNIEVLEELFARIPDALGQVPPGKVIASKPEQLTGKPSRSRIHRNPGPATA